MVNLFARIVSKKENKMDKIKLKIYGFIIDILMDIEDFFPCCESKVFKFRCKIEDLEYEIDLKYGEN